MTFYETITAAVADLDARGYDPDRVSLWVERIRRAARESLVPERAVLEGLRKAFGARYRRLVDGGMILKHHQGVSRYTLDNIKPRLRAELNRRVAASADLIRLNRDRAIEDTVQRFSGWASSVPPGGSNLPQRRETKEEVRRSMASLPFRERRVNIDQGHKFVANLNAIVAEDAGAIAAVWRATHRQGYENRPAHLHRDGTVFAVRGNWAIERGLMRAGDHRYTDEVEAPGEFVSCSCHYQYLYAPGSLPADMLTDKGRDELRRARAMVA